MEGITAEAHRYERLMEPQRGCKGLSIYRYSLMKRVMTTPGLEVRERRDHLEQLRQPRH